MMACTAPHAKRREQPLRCLPSEPAPAPGTAWVTHRSPSRQHRISGPCTQLGLTQL